MDLATTTLPELAATTLLYMGYLALAFFACVLVCPHGVDSKWEVAHILLWLPFTPYLLFFCYKCVFESSGSIEDRWFGSSAAGLEFMQLYIAAQSLGVFIELALEGPLAKKVPMLVHHITSVGCFTYGALSGRMYFWASLAGVCETSTMFLNVVLLSKVKGGGVADWMAKNLGGLPLTINGALLWLAFLLCRVLLFPGWLLLFVRDYSAMTPGQQERVTSVELGGYGVTVVLLWVLSMMWFLRVHAGFMKAVKAFLSPAQETKKEK